MQGSEAGERSDQDLEQAEHARFGPVDRSGEEQALADLDAALSQIDAVLAKYKK